MSQITCLANSTNGSVNYTIWKTDGSTITGVLTPDNGTPGWLICLPMTPDMTWIGLNGVTPDAGDASMNSVPTPAGTGIALLRKGTTSENLQTLSGRVAKGSGPA